MQLVGLSELLNDVRLEVPGAPNPLIIDRARMALTEFCKRTLISNETLQAHDIEAGEPLVKLSPPNACVNIWRVMWVKTSTGFLAVQDRQQLSDVGADWDLNESEHPYAYLPYRQNNIIQLYPKPTIDISDEVVAHCAFVPHPETTKMDAVIYQFYKEAIITGTVAKLQKMAGTGWYDLSAALLREREFSVEITKAKANQGKDNSLADLSVVMRPFA